MKYVMDDLSVLQKKKKTYTPSQNNIIFLNTAFGNTSIYCSYV